VKQTSNNPVTRLINATRFSWQGLMAAYKNEQAFRQEVLVFVIVVPLAFYLTDVPFERALLIASWMLVMIFELLNSAIEAVVDRFGEEHHELSGRAKDIGSAAVLVALLLSIVIWAGVLWA